MKESARQLAIEEPQSIHLNEQQREHAAEEEWKRQEIDAEELRARDAARDDQDDTDEDPAP